MPNIFGLIKPAAMEKICHFPPKSTRPYYNTDLVNYISFKWLIDWVAGWDWLHTHMEQNCIDYFCGLFKNVNMYSGFLLHYACLDIDLYG